MVLGSVVLGSVVLGSVVLGSVVLGSVVLGSGSFFVLVITKEFSLLVTVLSKSVGDIGFLYTVTKIFTVIIILWQNYFLTIYGTSLITA